MVFGLLHKLPSDKKINLAVSVAGFYKDEGWNCEGLFSEPWDWKKIKNQAKKIYIVASDNDPYIKIEQTNYLASYSGTKPLIMSDQGHFSLKKGPQYKKFPLLIDLIEKGIKAN